MPARDPRIEAPSNLWLIHPLGRRLLPLALRCGLSADAVSALGLALGAATALAYGLGRTPGAMVLALGLSLGWLVLDGLDGMVARARGTASAHGRLVDGLCDHGSFALIYVALALRVGTAQGWALAIAAGLAHAAQASLYEGARARFHRRVAGLPAPASRTATNPILRFYDRFAALPARRGAALDRQLAVAPDPAAARARYVRAATGPMRVLLLQTANIRVGAIFAAMLVPDPRLFWWFEIGPLTLAAIAGLAWHRRVERTLIAGPMPIPGANRIRHQGQDT